MREIYVAHQYIKIDWMEGNTRKIGLTINPLLLNIILVLIFYVLLKRIECNSMYKSAPNVHFPTFGTLILLVDCATISVTWVLNMNIIVVVDLHL